MCVCVWLQRLQVHVGLIDGATQNSVQGCLMPQPDHTCMACSNDQLPANPLTMLDGITTNNTHKETIGQLTTLSIIHVKPTNHSHAHSVNMVICKSAKLAATHSTNVWAPPCVFNQLSKRPEGNLPLGQ